MDHNRAFKELLSTFFIEFAELFLPDVVEYLDSSSIEFLDKEVFTDVIAGEKHEVDLVVKTRSREQETFFLILVEYQASAQSNFPRKKIGSTSSNWTSSLRKRRRQLWHR